MLALMDDGAAAGVPDSAERTPNFPRSVVVVAASLVALAPLLVVILTRSFRHWTPVQDMAIIDLRVRDVFTPNWPITGPYSYWGWNHPGPLEYWSVAVFGLPFGRPAWATLVGHALLQLVALGAVLHWATRVGRSMTLVIAVFIALSYGALGPWLVLEPWNPHVAYSWWVAFLSLIWLVLRDRTELLAALIVGGTVLVQLHVGYVPMVVAPMVLAVWWVWRDATTDEPRRAVRRSVGWGVLWSAVLWLPVAIDQLIQRPGNIERLVRFFRDPPGAPIGLRDGAKLIAEGFSIPPNWWGRPSHVDPFDAGVTLGAMAWLVVAVVLLMAAAIAAPSVGRWAHRLVVMDAVLIVTGIGAASRVIGTRYGYVFYWRIPVAIFVWLSCLTIVALAVAARWPAMRRDSIRITVCATLLVLIAIRAAPAGWRVANAPAEISRFTGIEQTTQHLLDAIAGSGRPTQPVLVRSAGGNQLGLHGGLVNGLDRQGVDVRVPDGLGFKFGYDRQGSGGAREVWYTLETGALYDVVSRLPGARTVQRSTPLSASDDRRLGQLNRRIIGQLVAAGHDADIEKLGTPFARLALADVPGIDVDALAEVSGFNARMASLSCRCAIVSFPIAQDPDVGSDRYLSAIAALGSTGA